MSASVKLRAFEEALRRLLLPRRHLVALKDFGARVARKVLRFFAVGGSGPATARGVSAVPSLAKVPKLVASARARAEATAVGPRSGDAVLVGS